MWKELRQKVISVQMRGVFIAKGETDPCDYSTTLRTVQLPSLLTYMTLCSTSASLGFQHYITLINNKPIMEMWVTWIMTWLKMIWQDNAGTFMLLLECTSCCSAVKWWRSAWSLQCSFIHSSTLWTCPSACAPFVHPIRRLDMFVGVPVPEVTHEKMTSNQKPTSLPWHMIIQM